MSGQISALWNIFGTFPAVVALLAGGRFSDLLEGENADQAAHSLFLAGAAILAAVSIFALWRPANVYDNVATEGEAASRPLDDIKRLALHRPIYPALTIWLLWNFAPGAQTPLQYYLQNTLQAEDSQWGAWNAIFSASFVPTFLAYGFLCRRFPLKNLLLWGTVIAVPQFVPLLFIHSVTAALIAAVPGRHCDIRLFGLDHSLLSAGPSGKDVDDVRQTLFHRRTIWRCFGDEPL
jgi:Na+/melibiose symporter-like transporter